ncbi:MAG: flagellar biosynthesis protein FlgG, partial [Clostridiales bacterium]|nr:flagellar biosynthesis protein FlgG [Clostridiales bacterium]
FEQSNVDAAYEMTKAMEIQRSYEACSAAIRMIDSINSSTTELGKI